MKLISPVIFAGLLCLTFGSISLGVHMLDDDQSGDATTTIYFAGSMPSGWDNTVSRYKVDGEESWEFYDNKDLSGDPFMVVEGPVDWTSVPMEYNDKLSAVKKAGDMLLLGKHSESTQAGDAVLGVDGPTNLPSVWDNTISRYKVEGEETWEFYDNNDYGGEPLLVVNGPVDWTWVPSSMNDKTTSVKRAGPILRLYKHYDQDDNYVDVQGDIGNMPAGWDNTVSRAKALQGSWNLFQQTEFKGCWAVQEGETFLFSPDETNDSLSSALPSY